MRKIEKKITRVQCSFSVDHFVAKSPLSFFISLTVYYRCNFVVLTLYMRINVENIAKHIIIFVSFKFFLETFR